MNRLVEYVAGFSMVSGPMGAGSPPSASPVTLVIDAEGLATFRPEDIRGATSISADDWDSVDREVQDSLSKLTARVLARHPEARSEAGRTTARAFALFSYRVFYHLDGDDYDPVIVGLTFRVRGASVLVSGDVSGDESGFVYYDESCTADVSAEPRAVRQAARLVAQRLAAQEAIVLDAIRNRQPLVDAR